MKLPLELLLSKEPTIIRLLKEGKTPEEVVSYIAGVDIDFVTELKEVEGL